MKHPFVYVSLMAAAVVVWDGSALASDAQAALRLNSSAPAYVVPAHLSDEEKRWFKTFHEGNFLSEGWQEITAYLLARTPAEQQARQKNALDNLGRKIALEWCRDNDVRKVDSTMLQEWGGLLKKTANTNPADLPKTIAYIDEEVDAVLD